MTKKARQPSAETDIQSLGNWRNQHETRNAVVLNYICYKAVRTVFFRER